jgi:hypothetical protein
MVPFTTMFFVVFLEISLELALMLMGMGLVRGVLTICRHEQGCGPWCDIWVKLELSVSVSGTKEQPRLLCKPDWSWLILDFAAVWSLWEWLYLWQVWVLSEWRRWTCGHRFLQVCMLWFLCTSAALEEFIGKLRVQSTDSGMDFGFVNVYWWPYSFV